MAPLNLLEGKEFSKEVDLESALDQSTQEIQKDKPQPDELQPVEVEEEKSEPKDKTPKSEKYEPVHKFRRSSPWPIVLGIIGGLILILSIVFNPFRSIDDNKSITEQETTQQTPTRLEPQDSENIRQEGQITSTISPENTENPPKETASLPSILDSKLKQSTTAATFLVDFISAIPSGIKVSFFRCSGNGYLGELISQSEMLFTELENNLATISADISLGTLSQVKQLGDITVLVRQIRGSIPASSKTLTASGSLDDSQIQSSLTLKATQGDLQIRQIDISPEIFKENMFQKPVTVKFTGSLSSVVSFLQDLLTSYKNVRLNKITITETSKDLTDLQVNSVLDLDVFSR